MLRSFGGWGLVPIPPDERREMYILDVITPGKMLDHRGQTIRTPAQFVVTETELRKFEVVLRQVGATEYKVRSKDKVDAEILEQKKAESVEEIFTVPEGQDEAKETIVEELMDSEEETRSVLDQLIKDAEKE